MVLFLALDITIRASISFNNLLALIQSTALSPIEILLIFWVNVQ